MKSETEKPAATELSEDEKALGFLDVDVKPEKEEKKNEATSDTVIASETKVGESPTTVLGGLKLEKNKIEGLINHSEGLSKEEKKKLLENKKEITKKIIRQQCKVLGINFEDVSKEINDEEQRQLKIAFNASYGTDKVGTQEAQETLMLVKNPKLLDNRYDAILNSNPSFLNDKQKEMLCDPRKNGTGEISLGNPLNALILNKEDVAILTQAGFNVNEMKRGWLGFSSKISFGKTEFVDLQGLNNFIFSEKKKYIIEEAKKRLELRKQKTIDENIEQNVLDIEVAKLSKEIENIKEIAGVSRRSGGSWREEIVKHVEDKEMENDSVGMRSSSWQESYLNKIKEDNKEEDKSGYKRLYDYMTSEEVKNQPENNPPAVPKPEEKADTTQSSLTPEEIEKRFKEQEERRILTPEERERVKKLLENDTNSPSAPEEKPEPEPQKEKTPEQIKEEILAAREDNLIEFLTKFEEAQKKAKEKLDKEILALPGDAKKKAKENAVERLQKDIDDAVEALKNVSEQRDLTYAIKLAKEIIEEKTNNVNYCSALKVPKHIEREIDIALEKSKDKIFVLSDEEILAFENYLGKFEGPMKKTAEKILKKIVELKAVVKS